MAAISKHMIIKEFDVNASHVDQRRVDVSLKRESPLMAALKDHSKLAQSPTAVLLRLYPPMTTTPLRSRHERTPRLHN